MLFSSHGFIFVFLPGVLAAYYLAARLWGNRGLVACLVGFSFVFYSVWNLKLAGLLAVSICVNYTIGFLLSTTKVKSLLILGVGFNLALLGTFKYLDFFVGELGELLGFEPRALNLLLPIGISFYSFQQIAFLVDRYRGKVSEASFLRYCLFVSFFPQMIAGPIVHHREMMPQFRKFFASQFASNVVIGASIFCLGLFKKTVIADGLDSYTLPFDQASLGAQITLLEAWGATLAYTFQIYFDFSAYSDMALGLARMFGITLPANFLSPYKSKSVTEFWRRWHITLSRFLRDYLYVPLGF